MNRKLIDAQEYLFEGVEFPGDCEEIECGHLGATPDGYGTGDSPTLYECGGCAEECPVVSKILG